MATTSIVFPTANAVLSTALGDGITYGGWNVPERIYGTSTISSGVAVTTTNNTGNLWKGFSFGFPSPGTIDVEGVELMADNDPYDGTPLANMGNAGSTGSTESAVYKMYLYDGSAYAGVEFISPPNGSLSGDSLELTLQGGNKRYKNGFNSAGTAETIGGAADDLHGLSWNQAYVSDWGFAITVTSFVNTPVPVILRGIGLRITYTHTPPPPPDRYDTDIMAKVRSGSVNVSYGKISV
jgi:hypothetical protein